MNTIRSKTGLVLQGYFRIERFRGAANRAAVAQPEAAARLAPQPPRPELLPAKMRGGAAQAKPEREPGGAWSGAPRPELLPGMGPTNVRGPRRVAQARPSHGVSTTPIPAGQLRVIGEGRPLEPGIRRTMERFFQADFSAVRVHEGPAAQAMGALAFTLGEELHFAPGLYDPASREGVELLGHELTHVVQQRDGRVANPYGQGVAIVQDPALEAEADRMGQQIANEMWSGSGVGQLTMRGGSGSVPGRSSGAARFHKTPGLKPPRVILASSEKGWSQVKSKSSGSKMTREEAWQDDEIVEQAQDALNRWCQYQESRPKSTKTNGEDLVICLWVYVTNKGAIATAEATNENPGQKYRSKTPGKPTVCAEDMMCHEHPELTTRTLYSIAYNATQGMTWPACSSVKGGCRKLLADLGIVEPPYAGLERDLKGKRIYDS